MYGRVFSASRFYKMGWAPKLGGNGVKVKHSPILTRPTNVSAGGLLGSIVLRGCYIGNLGGDVKTLYECNSREVSKS